MAKLLSSVVNIVAPSSDYPNGNTKDSTQPDQKDGTNAGRTLFGDIIQFFQKLMIDASITANGNYDNVTNGYQLVDALVAKIRSYVQKTGTLTANSATASVDGLESAKTANTTATTYAGGFTNPKAGQTLKLIINDTFTTLSSGITKTGRELPCEVGDVWIGYYDGSSWKQIGGTVGMGNVFVAIDPPDAVGDWIAPSTTTFTDVDLSDDGVRKGADRALLSCFINPSVNTPIVQTRRNGSSATGNATFAQGSDPSTSTSARFEVNLDDDAVFEARFSSTWTATTNECFCRGFYI